MSSYNKNAVKEYFKNFSSFNEYDNVIGVHGNHISPDTRTLEEVFSEDLVKEINEKLAPISALFGYDIP
jgi:hypothetical protein